VHFAVGGALDPDTAKIKITIKPGVRLAPITQRVQLAVLDTLMQMDDVRHGVDRGHRHSDNTCEIGVWLTSRLGDDAVPHAPDDDEDDDEAGPYPHQGQRYRRPRPRSDGDSDPWHAPGGDPWSQASTSGAGVGPPAKAPRTHSDVHDGLLPLPAVPPFPVNSVHWPKEDLMVFPEICYITHIAEELHIAEVGFIGSDGLFNTSAEASIGADGKVSSAAGAVIGVASRPLFADATTQSLDSIVPSASSVLLCGSASEVVGMGFQRVAEEVGVCLDALDSAVAGLPVLPPDPRLGLQDFRLADTFSCELQMGDQTRYFEQFLDEIQEFIRALLIEFEGLARAADGCLVSNRSGPLAWPLDDHMDFQFYEGVRGGSAVLIGDIFDEASDFE